LQSFFFPEIGQAVRHFSDATQDPQSIVSKHPEDFTLFFCAEFDVSSGILKAEPTLLHVANAMELRAEVQKRAEQLSLNLARSAPAESSLHKF